MYYITTSQNYVITYIHQTVLQPQSLISSHILVLEYLKKKKKKNVKWSRYTPGVAQGGG